MDMPKIFIALDTSDKTHTLELVESLSAFPVGFKVGMQLFYAHGADIIHAIKEHKKPIFLDLKLHDIPNTVAGALASVLPMGVDIVTVHTSGGHAMLRQAVKTAEEKSPTTWLAGVTVLTHMDAPSLKHVGQSTPAAAQVLRLAKVADEAGLDAVVCSGQEVKQLKTLCPNLKTIVPGIRPEGVDSDDQKRTVTPQQALDDGANVLVIGRAVTQAENPATALKMVLKQVSR